MFQRITSPENAHTNNTLVLFQEIHKRNPEIFIKLLQSLFRDASPENPATIPNGVKLVSHYSQANFIQPGMLSQSGFQLSVIADCDSRAEAIRQKINVARKTFASLCCELRWAGRNSNLEQLTDDYTHYCLEQGLIENANRYMRVCPYPEESEFMNDYGVYAEPVKLGFVSHGYIGLYTKSELTCLWRVVSTVRVFIDRETFELEDFRLAAEKMEIRLDSGQICDERELRKKLASFIFDKWNIEGDVLRDGYRFYCGHPYKITRWSNHQVYSSKTLLSSGNDRYFFDLQEYFSDNVNRMGSPCIASGAAYRDLRAAMLKKESCKVVRLDVS